MATATVTLQRPVLHLTVRSFASKIGELIARVRESGRFADAEKLLASFEAKLTSSDEHALIVCHILFRILPLSKDERVFEEECITLLGEEALSLMDNYGVHWAHQLISTSPAPDPEGVRAHFASKIFESEESYLFHMLMLLSERGLIDREETEALLPFLAPPGTPVELAMESHRALAQEFKLLVRGQELVNRVELAALPIKQRLQANFTAIRAEKRALLVKKESDRTALLQRTAKAKQGGSRLIGSFNSLIQRTKEL